MIVVFGFWCVENRKYVELGFKAVRRDILAESRKTTQLCGPGVKPLVYSLMTPQGFSQSHHLVQASVHQTIQLMICYQNEGVPTHVRKMLIRDKRISDQLIEVVADPVGKAKIVRERKKNLNQIVKSRIQQKGVLSFVQGRRLNFHIQASLPDQHFIVGKAEILNGRLISSFTVYDSLGQKKNLPLVGELKRGSWAQAGDCHEKAERGVRNITAGTARFKLYYCNEYKNGEIQQRFLQVHVHEESKFAGDFEQDLSWYGKNTKVKFLARQGYDQICDHIVIQTPVAQYRVLTGRWVQGCLSSVGLSWPDPIFGGGFDVPVKVRYAGQPWRLSFGQETQDVFLP